MAFSYREAERRGNYFGVGVVIDAGASVGINNVFHDRCVIRSCVVIGDENLFSPGVVVGSPSRQRMQPHAVGASPSSTPVVEIGNHNFLEDYVTIQSPLWFTTKIGNDICLGAHTHVAHDVVIRHAVTTAASCAIGGWAIVGEGANLGMGVTVHPRTAIGAWSMVGANAAIVRHIVPGALVMGVPAIYRGVNRVGLIRSGFSQQDIEILTSFLERQEDGKPLPDRLASAMQIFKRDAKWWGRIRTAIPNVDLGAI